MLSLLGLLLVGIGSYYNYTQIQKIQKTKQMVTKFLEKLTESGTLPPPTTEAPLAPAKPDYEEDNEEMYKQKKYINSEEGEYTD